MKREEILDTAKRTVCHDRNNQYGEPEDNFSNIANFWSVYLAARNSSRPLGPEDVANMMILCKIARNIAWPKADNWIDIAGYAACGGEIAGSIDYER